MSDLEISPIFNSVVSLFIMILIGVYSSKKQIITSSINQGLTDLLIQVSLPLMILTSFMFKYDSSIKSNITKTLFYSIIAYILVIILSRFLLGPIKGDKKTILHFSNVFTNTGYVGFPILYSIYGPEGVIYGSIFNMFFVIFVWTYGLLLFKGNFDHKDLTQEILKILLNPSIIAVFMGVIILIYDIQLPEALSSSIKSMGNMAGPLSMIIIGVILSNVKIKKHLRDWTIYYGIIMKLLVLPIIIYLLFLLAGDMSKVTITIIIMVAMPASAMTSIFAESYGVESEYAAILVSSTTLLSLITVPILLKIISCIHI